MLYCTKPAKYINFSNLLPHSSVFCRKPALQPFVSQTKTESVRVQSAQLIGHALVKTNIYQIKSNIYTDDEWDMKTVPNQNIPPQVPSAIGSYPESHSPASHFNTSES